GRQLSLRRPGRVVVADTAQDARWHAAAGAQGRNQGRRIDRGQRLAGPAGLRRGQGQWPLRPGPHPRRPAATVQERFRKSPGRGDAGRLGQRSGQVRRRGPERQQGAQKARERYRCKLEMVPQGDSAVVRGKVWPRDKPEPAEWTVEVTDPRPNREGSPALYGYAQGILDEVGGAGAIGAEAFYDNVSVTPR